MRCCVLRGAYCVLRWLFAVLRAAAVVLALSLGLCGCHEDLHLEGIYVRSVDNSTALAEDTFLIEPFSASTFIVTRMVGYQKRQAGKLLPRAFSWQQGVGEWHDGSRELVEQKWGYHLRFSGGKLLVDNTLYQKVGL